MFDSPTLHRLRKTWSGGSLRRGLLLLVSLLTTPSTTTLTTIWELLIQPILSFLASFAGYNSYLLSEVRYDVT